MVIIVLSLYIVSMIASYITMRILFVIDGDASLTAVFKPELRGVWTNRDMLSAFGFSIFGPFSLVVIFMAENIPSRLGKSFIKKIDLRPYYEWLDKPSRF